MNSFINAIQNRDNRLCLHILVLALFFYLLQFFQSELLFHRDLINSGQLWRLLTGNWVHTNYTHLLMNLTGLSFICLLFKEHINVKIFYSSAIFIMICVGLGLYLFSKQLIWYAGLSGTLYGLYMVAAGAALKHKDYITSLPILVGIPTKLFWDYNHSELTQNSAALIGAPVITDAHIYGLLAGIFFSITIATFRTLLRKNETP